MNKENLKQLDGFTGTQGYTRLTPWPMMVTDGAMFLAENADCFWLLQEIAGLQSLPTIRRDKMLRDYQFWKLVKDGERARLICERDAGDVAFTKIIPFTDFPFDSVPEPALWVAPTELEGKTVQVMYLPSEH